MTEGLEELVDVIACAIIPASDDDTDEEWCVVDAGGRIWRTETHGSTHLPQEHWHLVDDTGGIIDLAFATSQNGLAVGVGGVILRTTDGGLTWTASPSGTSENFSEVSFRGRTAYVCGGNGTILKSTDSGVTWSAPLTTGISSGLLSVVHRGAIAWACSAADLIRSDDGGVTWSAISGITDEMTYVTFNSESKGVVVFTTGPSTLGGGSRRRLKVFRTTNRGGTWTLALSHETPFTGSPPAEDIDISGAVAQSNGTIDAVGGYRSGSGRRVWIWSSDSGATWTVGNVANTSLRPTTHWDIDASPRGGLLVAADHNGGLGIEGRLNPSCVLASPSATGTSPTAYGVARADTPTSLIYNGHEANVWTAAEFYVLYAAPILPPCVWRSSINVYSMVVTDINFDLNLSGTDATLTLSFYGDTLVYTKPKADWVWGRNLMQFASASAGGQPNVLRMWICVGGVVLCPLCTRVPTGFVDEPVSGLEWSEYSVTIPAITGVTAGGTGTATWQRTTGCTPGGPGLCFRCEYEVEIDGRTAALWLGRDTNWDGSPIEYAVLNWGNEQWTMINNHYYTALTFLEQCDGYDLISGLSQYPNTTPSPTRPNAYYSRIP